MGSAFLKMKLKDQERSMQLLSSDPQLSQLTRLEASASAPAPDHLCACTKQLACAVHTQHVRCHMPGHLHGCAMLAIRVQVRSSCLV